MAQHKKKANAYQRQKLAKAQHKNEFFRKLKHIINSICGEDIYSQIPQFVLENLYNARTHSLKVVVPDGNNIPYEIVNDAKFVLSAWSKKIKIAITSNGFEITLDEFYTIALTIVYLNKIVVSVNLPYAARLKTGLQDYIKNLENLYILADTRLFEILCAFGLGVCDIGKRLYWLEHEIICTPDLTGVQNILNIFSHDTESTRVEINGHPRPVKRVGWAFASVGLNWITLKPSVFNIKSPSADIPLNVYIQSHALQRLSERIDCFQTGVIHFNMFSSLRDTRVFYDNHHNILIEFRIYNTKAGYFRVDMVEGMIVIRTFLFITNSGTPEGQKLEHNTGLQKLDKKYLAIDKLSTFMTSDIGNNQEVRNIFVASGCKCLIDLYEKMNPLGTKHSNQFNMNLMLKYLEYNKPETTPTADPGSN
jgi:hypothetical protein